MSEILLVSGQYREHIPWTPPVVDPEPPSGDLEAGDRILWLGDSTVFGHNSSNGSQVSTPVSEVLEDELGSVYPVDYEGVGLATTSNLLAGTGGFSGSLDSILAANTNAKIVIITFGINDSYLLSNAVFKANLVSIVNKIKAAGKIPVLETPNPTTSNLDTAVMTIKTVCTEQDVYCNDQFDYINGLRMDDGITSMMPDGIHPNQATYTLKGWLAARNIILWFGLDPRIPKLADLLIRPFREDSAWNKPISGSAVFFPSGDARTAEIRRTSKPSLSIPGISEGAGSIVWSVNVDNYGINTFMANRLTPKKSIRVRDIYGPGGIPRYDYYVSVPWPTGTVPAGGTDKHLSIIDVDAGVSHDFWYCNPIGGGDYQSASYSCSRLDGTGWSQFPYILDSAENPFGRNDEEALYGIGASRAVSVSCQGGLITKADADRGVIDHVLAIAVPRTYINRGPRVWPADMTNGNYDGDARSTGPLKYSQLVALHPSYNLDDKGFSPVWRMVAEAAKLYGMRLVDVAGTHTPCIYVSNPLAYTFGMLLRNGGTGNSGGQSTHFPKIWQNLHYVED